MELQGFLFCITLYCRSPLHPGFFIPIILESNNHIRHPMTNTTSGSSYFRLISAIPTLTKTGR